MLRYQFLVALGAVAVLGLSADRLWAQQGGGTGSPSANVPKETGMTSKESEAEKKPGGKALSGQRSDSKKQGPSSDKVEGAAGGKATPGPQ